MECKDDKTIYIRKSKDLIKSIPTLKNAILDLREKLSDSGQKYEIDKLKQLASLLQFLINSLKKIGQIGDMLIDLYFNEMTKKDIADKYDYNYRSVRRILNGETNTSFNAWYELSIILYGIEAVRLRSL